MAPRQGSTGPPRATLAVSTFLKNHIRKLEQTTVAYIGGAVSPQLIDLADIILTVECIHTQGSEYCGV